VVLDDEPFPLVGDGEGLEDCECDQESGEQLCVLLQQEERAHRASVELMNDGQQNMVLSEDAYIEKLMNVPLMIASTEAYIYSVEGLVRGREFTDFMVKNHNQYV
jgi:hypothetical protein